MKSLVNADRDIKSILINITRSERKGYLYT